MWIFTFFVTLSLLFSFVSNVQERAATKAFLAASVAQMTNLDGFNISYEVYDKNGDYVKSLEASPSIIKRLSKEKFEDTFWAFLMSVFASFAATFGFFYLAFLYFEKRGKKMAEDTKIRGASEVLSRDELVKKLHDSQIETSKFKVAGVPIPSKFLARNFLATGSMGTGKSQAIFSLIQTAREENKKCVFYDKTGEITSIFYDANKDILLNPFDERCAHWNIFKEIRHPSEPALLASFFIPKNPKSSDEFFDNAARSLVTDLLKIGKKRGWKTQDFIFYSAVCDLEKLHELLKEENCISASSMSPHSAKTALSIRSTLTASPAFKAFEFLEPQGEFSIRDWFEGEDKSDLFIASNAAMHEAIKPLASMFINIFVLAVMSKEPDLSEPKNFLFLDELASLDKIKGIETALTEARKFGLCTVVGFQNVAQLDAVYGKEARQVIMSNLQNKLILRVPDGETAKIYAEELGKIELYEVSDGQGFGVDSIRDSTSLNRKRAEKNAVTASEIQYLPDLQGFLKLAGEFPVAKVEVGIVSREAKNPPLVLKLLSTGEAENKKEKEAKALETVETIKASSESEPKTKPKPKKVKKNTDDLFF